MARPLFRRMGPGREFPASVAPNISPPFFQSDWSMPWKALPADTGEMSGSEVEIQKAPFNQDVWGMPVVVAQLVPALVVGSLLLTSLAIAPRPVQGATSDPPKQTRVDVQFQPRNLLTGTLPAQALALSDEAFTLPYFKPNLPDFRPPNLLESSLAAPVVTLPFSKTDWSLPWKAPYVEPSEHFDRPVDVNSPIASGTPFVPLAFPLPARTFSQPGFQPPDLELLQLATPAITPFVPVAFPLPPRAFFQPGFQPPDLELFQLVAAATKPFLPVFFPLPPRLDIDVGEHYARPVDVNTPIPPASGIPFLPVTWSMPYVAQPPRQSILYRLPAEVAAAPFSQDDWPLPFFKRSQPDFKPNNLLAGIFGIVPERPFKQTEFSLPYFKVQHVLERTWNQNLLESTLGLPPNPKPFLLADWSRPYEIKDGTYLKLDWVQNPLIGTLSLPPVIVPVEDVTAPIGHPAGGGYYKKKLIKVPLTEREKLEVALGERVEELYDQVTHSTVPDAIKEKAAEIVRPAVEKRTQEVDLVKAAKDKEIVAKLEALQKELMILEDDQEIFLAVRKLDEDFEAAIKAIVESLKNALI